MEHPAYYSVSRLKTYHECSAYYEHKYIKRTPHDSQSDSTVTGSLCHGALELFYSPKKRVSPLDAFNQTSKSTLLDIGVVPPSTPAAVFDPLYQSLFDFSNQTQELYLRSHPDYTGPDAIRKRDGQVADCPQLTGEWKQAARDMDLVDRSIRLDEAFRDLNSALRNISVSGAFAEAHNLMTHYQNPAELTAVAAVEWPISEWQPSREKMINPVLAPSRLGGEEGIYLKGSIDLIAKVGDKIALIDHKTSKEHLSVENVTHHVQLNVYAYCYHQRFGHYPDYLGINSIRHSELTLAHFNEAVMIDCVTSLLSAHPLIKNQFFKKHFPDSAYSPCIKRYGSVCPFLKHCHPNY